jgi:hypothetical protein
LSKEQQQTPDIDQWLRAYQGDFYKVNEQNKTRELIKNLNPSLENQIGSIEAIKRDSEFYSRDIKVLSDQEFNELKEIQEPSILEAVGTNSFVADTFLGAGHYMYTRGTVDPGGIIRANTRTRTVTWFGGYHGGVYCIPTDANGIGLAQTPLQRYGVDGTAIGRSDRTDYWSAYIGPEVYQRTKKIACIHTWAPDDMVTRLRRANAIGKSLVEFIKTIADIIKYIIAIFA